MFATSTLTDEGVKSLLVAGTHTFNELVEQTGRSRGKLYRFQIEQGLRRNELRIRRRTEARRMQEEFLEEILNETVTGDVLDFLGGIPDESIAAVITSPPYNVGKSYDANPANDSMRPLRYYAWMCAVIDECERVIAPGGIVAMVLGGTRDREGNIIPLDWVLNKAFEQTPLSYVNRIAWPTHAGLVPNDRLAARWESIIVYSKGPASFNPNAARVPQKEFDKRAFRGPNRGKATCHPLGGSPVDWWADIKHLGHNHPEKVEHPCQFPVALPRRIMLLWTRPGDRILDIFSGSGSTHQACIETGRVFSGCDLAYDGLRKARIAAVKPDLVSPLSGVTPESLRFWRDELAREATGTAIWQARATAIHDDIAPISDERDRALVLDLFGEGEPAIDDSAAALAGERAYRVG